MHPGINVPDFCVCSEKQRETDTERERIICLFVFLYFVHQEDNKLWFFDYIFTSLLCLFTERERRGGIKKKKVIFA